MSTSWQICTFKVYWCSQCMYCGLGCRSGKITSAPLPDRVLLLSIYASPCVGQGQNLQYDRLYVHKALGGLDDVWLSRSQYVHVPELVCCPCCKLTKYVRCVLNGMMLSQTGIGPCCAALFAAARVVRLFQPIITPCASDSISITENSCGHWDASKQIRPKSCSVASLAVLLILV